ncbi:MAG: hypothetical protein KA712_16940 [Myxococcales bacterium]|nr:hypothetical protein [Myxococcales bacterium]
MAGPVDESDLAQARSLGIETCGRIAAFWGFTRTMGRAFGLLYLAPEPLSRLDVQKRLHISAGNASMTLAALVRWGVVKKLRPPGSRQDHYEAETDFWHMISSVLNERERKEIHAAVGYVDRACRHARAARRQASGAERKEAAFALERLTQLQAVCQVGETLLDMLLGELSLDIGRFREVFRSRQPQPAAEPRDESPATKRPPPRA